MDQRALIAALTEVAGRKYPHRLERSYDALRLVLGYIEAGLPEGDLQSVAPLRALVAALSDVLRGAKPPLFDGLPKTNGAPASKAFANAQGAIAATAELLIRAGMPLREASRWVKGECKELGIGDKNKKEITAGQVASWRNRAGGDLPDAAQQVFDQIIATLPERIELMEAKKDAAAALRLVRDTGIAIRKKS